MMVEDIEVGEVGADCTDGEISAAVEARWPRTCWFGKKPARREQKHRRTLGLLSYFQRESAASFHFLIHGMPSFSPAGRRFPGVTLSCVTSFSRLATGTDFIPKLPRAEKAAVAACERERWFLGTKKVPRVHSAEGR